MSWIYYPEKFAIKILVFLLARLSVRGRENVPEHGAVLVVANHLSIADPAVLGVVLGRRAEFMAKEELFRSRFNAFFVRGFGSFPSFKGRFDREAIRQSIRVLGHGGALVMFPEGSRRMSGHLKSAYNGSALIALSNGVLILPVGITGTEKISGFDWILSRPRLTVTIGRPFQLPYADGKYNKESLSDCTKLIMRRIAELLPVDYRGEVLVGEERK